MQGNGGNGGNGGPTTVRPTGRKTSIASEQRSIGEETNGTYDGVLSSGPARNYRLPNSLCLLHAAMKGHLAELEGGRERNCQTLTVRAEMEWRERRRDGGTDGAIIDGPRSRSDRRMGGRTDADGCRRVIRGSFKSRHRNCLHDLDHHRTPPEEEHIRR